MSIIDNLFLLSYYYDMMEFPGVFLKGGLVLWICLTVVWLLSIWLKDAGIADIFWGLGFIIANIVYFSQSEIFHYRKLLMLALVSIWGLRLATHIYLRSRGKAEDYRYRAWRKENGTSWWWWSYFKVFMLQGCLLWLISLPCLAVQYSPHQPTLPNMVDILGLLAWGIGFFFESVADWQLTVFKFKPQNKGKLLTSGLWQYSRHPNYFGDALQWWAFYLLALNVGAWWSIISPLLITWLLLRVSGVPMLESSLKQSRPEYRDYINRTNAFLPWLPKRDRQ